MEELIVFKSGLSNAGLMLLRGVFVLMFAFPWIPAWLHADSNMIPFSIVVDAIVIAVLLSRKLDLKLVIDFEEQFIKYDWMRIWGRKEQVCVSFSGLSFHMHTINYKGNDLLQLLIMDIEQPANKIKLTEMQYGFNGRDIKTINEALSQIVASK